MSSQTSQEQEVYDSQESDDDDESIDSENDDLENPKQDQANFEVFDKPISPQILQTNTKPILLNSISSKVIQSCVEKMSAQIIEGLLHIFVKKFNCYDESIFTWKFLFHTNTIMSRHPDVNSYINQIKLQFVSFFHQHQHFHLAIQFSSTIKSGEVEQFPLHKETIIISCTKPDIQIPSLTSIAKSQLLSVLEYSFGSFNPPENLNPSEISSAADYLLPLWFDSSTNKGPYNEHVKNILRAARGIPISNKQTRNSWFPIFYTPPNISSSSLPEPQKKPQATPSKIIQDLPETFHWLNTVKITQRNKTFPFVKNTLNKVEPIYSMSVPGCILSVNRFLFD